MPTRKKGESKKKFIPRCIKHMYHNEPDTLTSKDKKSKQAYAICNNLAKKKESRIYNFDTFVNEKYNTITKRIYIGGNYNSPLDLNVEHSKQMKYFFEWLDFNKLELQVIPSMYVPVYYTVKIYATLIIEIKSDIISKKTEDLNYYDAIEKYIDLIKGKTLINNPGYGSSPITNENEELKVPEDFELHMVSSKYNL